MRIETDGSEAGELTNFVVNSDEISVRVSVAGHNLQIEAGPEEGGWALRRTETTFKWALKTEEAGEERHLSMSIALVVYMYRFRGQRIMRR